MFQQQNFLQPQVSPLLDAQNLYNCISQYSHYINNENSKVTQEIHDINQRIDYCKKHLVEQEKKFHQQQSQPTNNQQPQLAQQDPPGAMIDWVEKDVKQKIDTQIQAAYKKNKQIATLLLEVHGLMELYCEQQGRLKKNTAQELQLLTDLQSMGEALQAQEQILQQVQTRFDYLELNPKVIQIRKVPRVQAFDQQSVELLTKLKVDYHHSRIMLDKQRYFIDYMKKAVEDVK